MSDKLVIIPPDRRKHKEAIYDLFGKAFSGNGNGYWNMVDYCRRYYVQDGIYDWRNSRIGLIGDRVVTHFGIWNYQMRIGAGAVRVAGVGAVATHGEFRKRGHMAVTARACIEAMAEAGYDMTVLFGLLDFYHRFGYVRAWAPVKYFVGPGQIDRHLPAKGVSIKLRRVAPTQHADLEALYNRWYAPYVGTAVRPTFRGSRWPRVWKVFIYLWTGRAGKPAGYVLVKQKDKTLVCMEAVGQERKILAALSSICKREKLPEVRFETLPYDHPVARRLRGGTCRTETHYVRSGGAMIRTANLRSVLSKIAGELTARLRDSHMRSWRGELAICDAREEVTLAIGRGKVKVAPLRVGGGRAKHAVIGGEEVAQLLIGTHSPDEIVAAACIKLTGDAKALIGVLFPEKHPVLSSWDYY